MSELWVVTGPNGAGKSTFAPKLCADLENRTGSQVFYFDPDEQMRLHPGDPLKVFKRFYGGTAEVLLAAQRGVVVETTVPGKTIFDLIGNFRDAGYKIGAVAIGVATIDLAKDSVTRRKAEGGHDVDPAVTEVTNMYCQSQTPLLLGLCDEAHLYDRNANGELAKVLSLTDEGYKLHCPAEVIRRTNPYMTGLLTALSLGPRLPGRVHRPVSRTDFQFS